MASFSIPLTGLEADSTALNTIANDLANMNTTGFKAQTTSFSDLLYQQIGTSGSGDSIQVGSGVKVAANTTDFTTGSVSSTDVSSDVAIDGAGFFVLDNGGGQLLTRDGAFQLSSNGTLESNSGLAVMGYPATNGVVNTGGTLTDIVIPTGQAMNPSATTSFSMTQSLDSNDAVNASTTGTVQVYDSLGNSYEATVTYTKTGTNQWSYSVSLPDTLQSASNTAGGVTTTTYDFGASGGTVATVDPSTNLSITGQTAGGGTATIAVPTVTAGEAVGTAGPPATGYVAALQNAITAAGIVGVNVAATAGGQLTITGTNFSTTGNIVQDPVASANASGALKFDADGNLSSPATNVSGITFSGFSDGAASLNLTWNLFGSNGAGNISQTASTSSTSSTNQNGYATGTYQSFSIGSDGTISVSYSNGQTKNVGQVAIATVSNQQGLVDLGSSEYQTTSASGVSTVGVAGTSGRGALEGSSLEASNVNISTEFSDLIVAQRAFEANAKSVTTFDTVTQDTINMVH
jgi:flagellar hook protein FlgE